MLAAVADHLWQSLLCFALGASLAALALHNAASIRLWLWRVCALKFLMPFALLFALGEWLGYPQRYSVDPKRATLVRGAATLGSWLSPAQTGVLSGKTASAFLVAGLAAAFVCVQFSRRRQHVESARAVVESVSIEAASDDAPPPLGFLKAALFTSCAISMIGISLMGGAIKDGLWRRELLAANAASLREAPVLMSEATPGMGARSRIFADRNGVLIRNINVQELIAVSYGVSHFSVTSDQMYPKESDPERNSWMLAPYYDVRIAAPIREPGEFDPYALRQRVTRLLVERFGLEIHVNGTCQRPCGRWDVAPDEPPLGLSTH